MDTEIRKRLKKELKLCLKILIVGIIYALWLKLTGLGIPCFFHLATHLECPGCGMTRAVMALLSLNVSEAFRLNPLSVTVVPLLIVIILKREYRYIRYDKSEFNIPETVMLTVMLVITNVFMVCRNIDKLIGIYDRIANSSIWQQIMNAVINK